jgi:ACR3 family arsenite efflux pump ArsB
MNISRIIERATDFGTRRSKKDFFSFSLKILLYIIPALILGDYTDTMIQNLRMHRKFGDSLIKYIALQTLVILFTLYIFVIFLKDFVSEFQKSIAGSFFIIIYFGMQDDYIHMMNEYLALFH